MFEDGTRVEIFGTNSTLDGVTGLVIGIFAEPSIIGFGGYVILVDEQYHPVLDDLDHFYSSIVIVNSCVKAIKNV